MGEFSKIVGEKLESYGSELFRHLGWEILGQNIQLPCTHKTHKNTADNEKTTHGIDILVGYQNPFSAQEEAMIIECKHREWKNFTKSNLTQWITELCNTIECASTSPVVTPLLKGYKLVGGMVMYNSSDNQYDEEKAIRTMSTVTVPKRRHPLMLYVADNKRLEQWVSLNETIDDIKGKSVNKEFNIIYPSIGGSSWKSIPTLTPSYLFSDFIMGSHTEVRECYGNKTEVDIKTIFCFESVTEDGLQYLQSMINELQLEARGGRAQEMHLYFYPESAEAVGRIKALTLPFKTGKSDYKIEIMDNRKIAKVNYTDWGGDR